MRTVLITDILERARLATDTKYSQHTTDQELYILLAQHYRELYNIMTQKDESLFQTTVGPLTIVDGVYTLPSDFFKILDLYEKTSDYRTPLKRANFKGQSQYNSNLIAYIPTYTLFRNTVKFTPKSFTRTLYLDYLPLPADLNTKATGVLGDLTETPTLPTLAFTAKDSGIKGNSITVTLVPGGTAGSEVVTVTDYDIAVSIGDGVSTASQIKTALDNSEALTLISTSVTVAGAMSAGTVQLDGGAEELEVVCNEDDYLVASLAVDIAVREESDTNQFATMKSMAYNQVINYLTPRDNGETISIRDVETRRSNWPGFGSMFRRC